MFAISPFSLRIYMAPKRRAPSQEPNNHGRRRVSHRLLVERLTARDLHPRAHSAIISLGETHERCSASSHRHHASSQLREQCGHAKARFIIFHCMKKYPSYVGGLIFVVNLQCCSERRPCEAKSLSGKTDPVGSMNGRAQGDAQDGCRSVGLGGFPLSYLQDGLSAEQDGLA